MSCSFTRNHGYQAATEKSLIYVRDAEVLGSNPGSPTRNMQFSGGYGPR